MPDTPDNQAPQASPSQPYIPPAPPVVVPPPKQGPSALKIVLIIIAVLFGIGIIGAGIVGYGVYKVAKAVKMSASSSQPVTESDLGVPIYPEATQGKGSLHMTIAGKTMTTANFLTPDSQSQVIAFYQNSMGPNARSTTSSNGGTIVLNKGSGETVTVTIPRGRTLNEGGETQIVIVHARTPVELPCLRNLRRRARTACAGSSSFEFFTDCGPLTPRNTYRERASSPYHMM